MKMTSMLKTQKILLVNWVVVPILGILVFGKLGFFKVVLFILAWLVIDKIWDWFSGLLIAGAGGVGGNEDEVLKMKFLDEVPGRVALMMAVDTIGTLLVPWIVAGLLLGWFVTASISKEDAAMLKVVESVQSLWWKSEYPALIKIVDSAANHSLVTSYRTGPDGNNQVKLDLQKEDDNGLVLKVELPKEGVYTVDQKTQKERRSETPKIIVMRDHNLDGMPDDFSINQSGEPLYKEKIAKDGFIAFRNSPEHKSILILWSTGIGFSVNHFIHGADSIMQR